MSQPPVTLLFTDLVNSSELLQLAGDERAQRIFRAHHRLLRRCVAAHDGQEVKWLGDGLMTVFASPADAVRCAVAMQQSARRRAAGERLSIRVGLNVGEVRHDESDYFGTPVVIARRLCDRAQAGQILCSAVVPGLLAGQNAFAFRECGPIEIKGLATPVTACEVLYRDDQPTALLTHAPFVGRTSELARLEAKLREAQIGQGGLVMLAGEPGIGKTRILEEFAETARSAGVTVLWGRCYEGDAARPYGPFVEAIAHHARTADVADLQDDLGSGAGPLARLVPALREHLPDIPEPAPLQPDEERVRLLDAVAQFCLALSVRTPLALVLDDLHWADGASVALLRHVARFTSSHRVLVLGAYRDIEVSPPHPLIDALGALPRETAYDHLALCGLTRVEVEQLLEAVADEKFASALVAALAARTSGNPFFIREVLLHLVEEGKIVWRESVWTSPATAEPVGIPPGVRQVIQRRLARLPERSIRLLRAAAGCSGRFDFDVIARVEQMDEADALDAIDDALAGQLVRAGDEADSFDFTHALVRDTLYAELSPPRQTRLHRRIAETMEAVCGERAAEIAYHYARSSTLPGAERGVVHALAAADRADHAYAREDSVVCLRMALQLLPPNDARRARIVGRLGMALGCTLELDDAIRTMSEAGDLIAATEGPDAAADYLADAVMGLWAAGSRRWPLAAKGLAYIDHRRDITWVRLAANDIIRREAEDPEYPGILVDTPDRRAVADVAANLSFSRQEEVALSAYGFLVAKSREDILRRFGRAPFWLTMGAGEYRQSVPLWEAMIVESEREGRIADAIACLAQLARCYYALGELAAAGAAYDRAMALAARITGSMLQRKTLTAVRFDMRTVLDQGWEDFLREEQTSLDQPAVEDRWGLALTQAAGARLTARLGGGEQALLLVEPVLAALERAPGWAVNYTWTACEAATALWLLGRAEHAESIERNLREKVLVPDFRCPTVDVRLSMAHLTALQGRYDEAIDWFAKARVVLDEQGARPLRATVDYDEALMFCRRAGPDDLERARPLLDAALGQFRRLGMTGWIQRAEVLRSTFGDGSAPDAPPGEQDDVQASTANTQGSEQALVDETRSPGDVAVLRREGEYWTLVYADTTSRLRDTKGLRYLSQLLSHPGKEFHALELIRMQAPGSDRDAPIGRGLEVLDPQAKAAYRRRLADLRGEIDDAEDCNDVGRAAQARTELEALTQQLAEAVGLGGRDRQTASVAERARSTVTQRIRSAIQKIAEGHPSLADRLRRRVRTGTFCVYEPDLTHPIRWDL